MSAENARLGIKREYRDDMPELGYYGMCRAIFELLETAPLDYRWLRTLYHVLSHLNYSQSAKRIDLVLERWAQLPDRVKEDRRIEGYYTQLCLRDEFRCFIAALFDMGYNTENNIVILHGNQDASDVALRCAYYAQGDLTAKDMEHAYKKDMGVFTFAASLNPRVHRNSKLRKRMEDEYVYADVRRSMMNRCENYGRPCRRCPMNLTVKQPQSHGILSGHRYWNCKRGWRRSQLVFLSYARS